MKYREVIFSELQFMFFINLKLLACTDTYFLVTLYKFPAPPPPRKNKSNNLEMYIIVKHFYHRGGLAKIVSLHA